MSKEGLPIALMTGGSYAFKAGKIIEGFGITAKDANLFSKRFDKAWRNPSSIRNTQLLSQSLKVIGKTISVIGKGLDIIGTPLLWLDILSVNSPERISDDTIIQQTIKSYGAYVKDQINQYSK